MKIFFIQKLLVTNDEELSSKNIRAKRPDTKIFSLHKLFFFVHQHCCILALCLVVQPLSTRRNYNNMPGSLEAGVVFEKNINGPSLAQACH